MDITYLTTLIKRELLTSQIYILHAGYGMNDYIYVHAMLYHTCLHLSTIYGIVNYYQSCDLCIIIKLVVIN